MTIEIDPKTGAPIIKSESKDFTVPTENSDGTENLSTDTVKEESPTVEATVENKEALHSSVDTPTVGTRDEGTTRTSEANPKQELLDKMNAVIAEFDGESNIPFGHDYWQWCNTYRSLK